MGLFGNLLYNSVQIVLFENLICLIVILFMFVAESAISCASVSCPDVYICQPNKTCVCPDGMTADDKNRVCNCPANYLKMLDPAKCLPSKKIEI